MICLSDLKVLQFIFVLCLEVIDFNLKKNMSSPPMYRYNIYKILYKSFVKLFIPLNIAACVRSINPFLLNNETVYCKSKIEGEAMDARHKTKKQI